MATHRLIILFLLSSQLITMSLSSLPPRGSSDPDDLPTLLKIKAQFGNPAALAEWQPGTDPCSWPYAYCNQYRRVVSLFLENVNITSTLPPAIGELDQLETLSIENMPGLHGPIPDSLGNLAHLSIFNLMVTSVSGPIPASHSRTNLTSVSFLRSRLNGTIPSSLRRLPYLTFFDAAHNDLEGPIPSLLVRGGTPDRPLGLMLDGNRLSGPVPWTYALERH
jgi:beta-glucosidase